MDDEFSGLTLPDEDPDSQFLNLFNRFSGQYPDIGQFLKPDDPDLLAYQRRSTEPTGSSELINQYISRMPTHEQYEPSLGDKLKATLVGMFAGGGPEGAYRRASEYVEEPYKEALGEWKTEGSNIATRAHLMDTERQRELAAMKLGLTTKAGAARSEASSKLREMAEARRIAAQVAAEREHNEREADRLKQEGFMNAFRTEEANRQKEMDAWRKQQDIERNTDRDEARIAREKALADKGATLEKTNSHIKAYAQQHGIDTTAQGITTLDIAKLLAFQRAQSYSFFKPVMGNNEVLDDKDPVRGKLLRQYIDSQVQKILRGEF